MRLPWLQLSSDGRRRAKMAGVLLGIGPQAGVGFVTDLWDAALELAPDGDFSGAVVDPGVLVAAAGGVPMGCTKDPLGVVEILQRVGLVASSPTLRVRGLDRYEATWRNNRKRRDRPKGATSVPPRKTETETETETEINGDVVREQSAPPPPTAQLRAQPMPVVAPDVATQDSWSGDEFWRWAESKRQKVGLPPERPPDSRALSTFWSAALMAVNGDVGVMRDAFVNFGEDKFWQAKSPPLPFRAFMSQWERWLPIRRKRA